MKKLIFVILIFVFISCGHEQPKEVQPDFSKYQAPLMKVNKMMIDKDSELIAAYVKRRQWKMDVSKTGLWYWIYKNGNGKLVEVDNQVTLKYKLSLLDGTLCYSSDSTGLKKFKAGRGGVETGLEQAILMMHKGDKAYFILPPHLAHGFLGDQKCIPARSIIVYDCEMVDVIRQ